VTKIAESCRNAQHQQLKSLELSGHSDRRGRQVARQSVGSRAFEFECGRGENVVRG
jgi:hypothetical protein